MYRYHVQLIRKTYSQVEIESEVELDDGQIQKAARVQAVREFGEVDETFVEEVELVSWPEPERKKV